MWAEQAIFTSLTRRGKAGYHLVARSPGLTDVEATALTTWAPSHGALIVDASNRTSVNFHSLPGGRHVLSRTCEGLAEYSGRGGRQLYTHALIVDDGALRQAGNQPFALYRDALALGHFLYRPDPEAALRPVPLSSNHAPRDADHWTECAGSLGIASLAAIIGKLTAGQTVEMAHSGDRLLLAECLTGLLPPESRPLVSFATSLRPSMVRPYQLVLIGATG